MGRGWGVRRTWTCTFPMGKPPRRSRRSRIIRIIDSRVPVQSRAFLEVEVPLGDDEWHWGARAVGTCVVVGSIDWGWFLRLGCCAEGGVRGGARGFGGVVEGGGALGSGDLSGAGEGFAGGLAVGGAVDQEEAAGFEVVEAGFVDSFGEVLGGLQGFFDHWESEEHTSELQSRLHLVCRLLLEKKKKKQE